MNSDSDSELAALRNQIYILLVALIVVSGTLTVYLYRQNSITGKDIAAIKPQADQVIATFRQDQPAIVNFVNDLVAYGQKHPEFVPVLAKYGIAPVKGVPAGSPAGAVPQPVK
ncbi:MAG TPA: hypothetical protein VH251_06045 [Verrucomicrobiae bacterium]|jgi:hypothetical protein|nr:hypothetical protein [Verrucomicrobiae bacterium]